MNGHEKIRMRYFRKVGAHSAGAVVHHGDCQFFSIQICTCGLLADLQAQTPDTAHELFPDFVDQIAAQDAVREMLLHQRATRPRRSRSTGG